MTLDRRAWLRLVASFVVGLAIGLFVSNYIYDNLVTWVPPVFVLLFVVAELLRTRAAEQRSERKL